MAVEEEELYLLVRLLERAAGLWVYQILILGIPWIITKK
jgi:hypothetical protein